MSCGATGCNARGAPRVGVPRRDESVATGDGALCDASTGPATRTAQRVGRGRVGGVHSHMNTQPPGSTPSPIASLPSSRASALGLHDPSRAPASALHGTIWAPRTAEEGTAGAGRVVHCHTLHHAPSPNAQQEPPWARPALRGRASPVDAPPIAPRPPLGRPAVGVHCSWHAVAPTQAALQDARRAGQAPERRRGPPADPSTHPHNPGSARATRWGAAAAHPEDGHFSADGPSRHAEEVGAP